MTIGDSALQANPLLGEGIRFIMEASRIAAKWIMLALEDNRLDLLKNYTMEWRKKYSVKYKIACSLQKKMKKISLDDEKLDRLIKKLKYLSDEDREKIIKGDFSYRNSLRILSKYFLIRFYGPKD